jgi:predicted XRE-type DNA-binding protein
MKAVRSSGNVFADIGFNEIEAAELAVKSDLVALIMKTTRYRKLSQIEGAQICGVDQPTLSKVLSGKFNSIAIDRLAKWLVALGSTVENKVRRPKEKAGKFKGAMNVYQRP